MQPLLFDGKYKVQVVKRTDCEVTILALEDALVKLSSGEYAMMHIGKSYSFCPCCFENHTKQVKIK